MLKDLKGESTGHQSPEGPNFEASILADRHDPAKVFD